MLMQLPVDGRHIRIVEVCASANATTTGEGISVRPGDAWASGFDFCGLVCDVAKGLSLMRCDGGGRDMSRVLLRRGSFGVLQVDCIWSSVRTRRANGPSRARVCRQTQALNEVEQK